MNLNDIRRIGIIGVGFMGGSLAKAIKKKLSNISIWGYARSKVSYNRIKKLNILDNVSCDLKSVVEGSDIVVLATPIYSILSYLKEIPPFLKNNSIVFDLGSVKEIVEKTASKYLPKTVNFVGCHPLCGGEKSGVEFSNESLYEKTICLITSSPYKKSTQKIKALWEKLGSKVFFISPIYHDKVLSAVSHLSHLISFSLTYFVPYNYIKFLPPSFKDLTRVSMSSSYLWKDIILSNHKNIIKDIEKFINILEKFKEIIKEKKEKKLLSLIEKINKKQEYIRNFKN